MFNNYLGEILNLAVASSHYELVDVTSHWATLEGRDRSEGLSFALNVPELEGVDSITKLFVRVDYRRSLAGSFDQENPYGRAQQAISRASILHGQLISREYESKNYQDRSKRAGVKYWKKTPNHASVRDAVHELLGSI